MIRTLASILLLVLMGVAVIFKFADQLFFVGGALFIIFGFYTYGRAIIYKEMPKDLKFLAKIRNDKYAAYIGLIILILISIFYVLTISKYIT